MVQIHPTAIVHPKSEIEDGVEIGPYAVVHEGAKIGAGTKIDAHAVIFGCVTLGKNNYVGCGVVIGSDPQDLSFKGQETFVKIGDNNVFKEYVTIHRATQEESATVIGNNCYFMAYSHVAHDCIIGNNVIATNYAGISGFVEIEDRAILSGHVGIHQFVRIGTLAFISGGSFPGQDIPPFTIAAGRPAKVVGLNVVGMRRAGIPSDVRLQIKRAFDIFYRKGLNRTHALEIIEREFDAPEVKHFVEFIKRSKRGVAGFAKES
ncbi:UDP-N-acetylglucosamine acyltransferase [Thermosulfidibacter takaii ABI70S6]|uniref:UDP-N-acetylglucosamine acyltransferase n=1 Tax=Thermosulfidibacter takaii (strain DSM 17441 / JCM 13301 / NBRC 103674 / ABI70S6) TaxID=1298851 RepID=A0A0S3QTU0_THET7|nr:acyl-ACP--UDP-N-acetylglucosamine O-acyltransferase [Thermosulfidibacter takaii]BAT71717.1 UDP-N-acetylglucosamine acyltransferase [Thermosulfidibacter takaii ABI70S6]